MSCFCENVRHREGWPRGFLGAAHASQKLGVLTGLTFHSGMAPAVAPLDTLSRDPAFHTSIFILHADSFRLASGSLGKQLQLLTSLRRVG